MPNNTAPDGLYFTIEQRGPSEFWFFVRDREERADAEPITEGKRWTRAEAEAAAKRLIDFIRK